MLTKSKQKSVVGLDLEAGSVAATEVRANGSVTVSGHAVAPLAPGVFRDGELTDPEALGATLKDLFAEHKLSRDVRLGIANQRIAVRTLHLPVIEDPKELEAAIRFQARDHIPMPLDQAVLDWRVVGVSGGNGEVGRMDVVTVAARREMLDTLLEAMRRAGLRPVGIDLSAFGMIRALAGETAATPALAAVPSEVTPYEQRSNLGQAGAAAAPANAKLFCHLGDLVNLAVAQGSTCLFARVSQHGTEGIAQKLSENAELSLEHARRWLAHVGLEAPLEQIEGDPRIVAATRQTLADEVPKLVDELRVSLQYYAAQEAAVPVDGVVICGPGSTIPGLVEHLQHDLGYPFAVGHTAALSHLDKASAARLTLSYGLALEE